MLAVGIEYLNGWALAAHPSDRDAAEWPPHPDRIFMALAAAHFETDGGIDERNILEWLETIEQPTLLASNSVERSTVTTFVPVNDTAEPVKKGKALMAAGSMPIGRDRQPRTFPFAIPHDPIVYLVWESAQPTVSQLSRLADLCAKVTHVGHSASFVRMWIAGRSDAEPFLDEAPNESRRPRVRLQPTQDNGRYRLRVFGPGRLADLEARYNKAAIEDYSRLQHEISANKGKRQVELKAVLAEKYGDGPPHSLRPTAGLWQAYDAVPKRLISLKEGIVTTHWNSDVLVLSHEVGQRDRRFGLESTLLLTRALRNCVLRDCPRQPPPEWITGHGGEGRPSTRTAGHIAFIPLPHVGHRHADGHLLGLGLAIPRDVSRRELSECLNSLLFDLLRGLPRTITLTLGRLGECRLKLDEEPESRLSLRPETWTAAAKPATVWATVTPIALDRHGKGETAWEQIETTIASACERIGLPRPDSVALAPVSMFAGAPSARAMPRIERKENRGKVRHTHATITFPLPVVGPVVVGCGRYRGYGLCRPLPAEESR